MALSSVDILVYVGPFVRLRSRSLYCIFILQIFLFFFVRTTPILYLYKCFLDFPLISVFGWEFSIGLILKLLIRFNDIHL